MFFFGGRFYALQLWVDSATSQQLLGLIVQHSIIIRGFAVTARWLENFKINQKKIFRKL